jgi:hypothetical protein
MKRARKWISWENFDGFSDNSSSFGERFADGTFVGCKMDFTTGGTVPVREKKQKWCALTQDFTRSEIRKSRETR